MGTPAFRQLFGFLVKVAQRMAAILLVLFVAFVLMGDASPAEAIQATLDYFWVLALLGVVAASGGDGSALDEHFRPN